MFCYALFQLVNTDRVSVFSDTQQIASRKVKLQFAIYVIGRDIFTFAHLFKRKNIFFFSSDGFSRLIGDSDGCVQYVQVCAGVCVYPAI